MQKSKSEDVYNLRYMLKAGDEGMGLLSNNSSLQLTPPGPQNGNNNDANNELFISNLLGALPANWNQVKASGPMTVPSSSCNDDFLLSHVLGPIGTHSSIDSPNDLYGAVGTSALTPSSSPQTNSSISSTQCTSSLGIICGRCDTVACIRCLDCNDALCDECLNTHRNNSFTRDHCVLPLTNLSPIGPQTSVTHGSPNHTDPQCDVHNEALRYVCGSCKKIVCQECTLWEHKDHNCIPVNSFAEGAVDKIQATLESGKVGTKYIKASIDRAVTFSQAVERDAMEASQRVRKAMRHFIVAIEDRERSLLERVDKLRQQKLTSLSDQMAGLRAALAGLAQTSEMLTKAIDNALHMTNLEIAQTLTKGESQLEQFAAMYKSLQPKEEFITFVAPNFDVLQDIRAQGDVIMINQRLNAANGHVVANPANAIARRPILRGNVVPLPVNGPSNNWAGAAQLPINVASTSPNSIAPIPGVPNVGQCIPGSTVHVVAKPGLGPTTSFAFDGHEDGQVSRPWGLCVDKDGNIIVADRRNNRIQVFYPDGTFKLKFGTKGSGNGQFDLPAGICTDNQNRIIVVDKDNHRVQIFTAVGTFVLKFGSYGKDCGQFQYPWDVAVNAKGEMLVTDSRNHRIQLFNPDGHFISRFSFDGINHSRSLKGLTTPRGVCFTPLGDIIVSDFENHRLLLIDSCLTKILAAKGHEGSGIQEFSRPSGICCDDDGRVIVADSKNQRVVVFSPQLEFLWAVEIRPSTSPLMPSNMDEKDRPSDVSLLPNGRLVVMVETSPDARDTSNPHKTFVQIY